MNRGGGGCGSKTAGSRRIRSTTCQRTISGVQSGNVIHHGKTSCTGSLTTGVIGAGCDGDHRGSHDAGLSAVENADRSSSRSKSSKRSFEEHFNEWVEMGIGSLNRIRLALALINFSFEPIDY